jgi:hypothetical protein
MADQVHNDAPPQVDFETHARDWGRMTKMLKWGAVIVFILAMAMLVILAS